MKSRKLSSMAILASVIVVGGFAAWQILVPPGSANKPSPPPPPNEWTLKARQLQQRSEWTEAKEAWDQALTFEMSDADNAEAKRNQTICGREATRKAPPRPTPVDVPPLSENERPARISTKNLALWYPAGKHTRSVARLYMDGRGRNRAWAIQSEAHFTYLVWVDAETTVLECVPDTGRVRFKQHFHEVSQRLIIDDKSFEINMETTPILSLASGVIDRSVPYYGTVTETVNLVNVIDPGLKRTLTWVARSTGQDKDEFILPEKRAVTSQVDKLSGAEVEIEYVSGLGITKIKSLGGPALTDAELLNLAETLSVMMDYYVFPLNNKAVGDVWSVDAGDVGGLIALGSIETKVDGKLRLKRDPPDKAQPDLIPISVQGGDIELRSQFQSSQQSAHVSVESGTIEFSERDKIIRSARMTFRLKSLWSDPNSLMFGTEGAREISTRSFYESALLPN